MDDLLDEDEMEEWRREHQEESFSRLLRGGIMTEEQYNRQWEPPERKKEGNLQELAHQPLYRKQRY